MAVTVKHVWAESDEHDLEIGKKIHLKIKQMTADGKVVEIIRDPEGVPTSVFINQASAEEYVEFMKQFNPADVEVTPGV